METPCATSRSRGRSPRLRREFHDGDVVDLKLPMPVRSRIGFDGRSVCVTRGPLVFSLKIAEERVEHTNDPPDIKRLMAGHDIQGFPGSRISAAKRLALRFQPDIEARTGENQSRGNHDAGESVSGGPNSSAARIAAMPFAGLVAANKRHRYQ